MNTKSRPLWMIIPEEIEENKFMCTLFRKCLFILTMLFIGKALPSYSIFQDTNLSYDVSNEALSDEATMLYGFIQQEGKRIGEKYNMSLCAVGGGMDHLENKINLMSPGFQRIGSELTENEARKLVIQCLDEYLTSVNTDEKLCPFLKNYPFQRENIEMTIFCRSVDNDYVFHPFISVVSANQGEIGYRTTDIENVFRFKSRKYETYDEAVALLKNEKKDIKVQ